MAVAKVLNLRPGQSDGDETPPPRLSIRPSQPRVRSGGRQSTAGPQVKLAEIPQPESLIDAQAPFGPYLSVLLCNCGQLRSGKCDVMRHSCRVHEVSDERLVGGGQRRSQSQSDPKVPVGQAGKRGVEATKLSHQFGAGEDAGRAPGNDIPSEEHLSDMSIRRGLLRTHHA